VAKSSPSSSSLPGTIRPWLSGPSLMSLIHELMPGTYLYLAFFGSFGFRFRLQRRFRLMAIVNLIFGPFIVVYVLIYSFFRYFEVSFSESNTSW
jgi:hypothetical protein